MEEKNVSTFSNLNELKDIPPNKLTDKEKKEIKGHIYEFLERMKQNIFEKDHKSALMFIRSLNIFFDKRLIDRTSSNNFKVGQVYFANMLLGYKDEIAYEHPVLILGKGPGSLFVVPATSNFERKDSAYNIEKNEGEEDLIMIQFPLNPKNHIVKKKMKDFDETKEKNLKKGSDGNIHSFSVFQLNNAQMISTIKISGSVHYGKADTKSEEFQYATDYLLGMMFSEYAGRLKAANKTIDSLSEEIKVFKELEIELIELKKEVEKIMEKQIAEDKKN